MKVFSPLVLLTCCSLLATQLLAAQPAPEASGCLAKSQEISRNIEEAKTAGDKRQQAGLEKALSEANANCTEASLLKEHEQKVLEAKREVKKREADLSKAMAKGDPERINKRKDKLAESRKELQDAQAELEELQPQD
jgi:DNA repair exonuclease SbcCD ATPase subunit